MGEPGDKKVPDGQEQKVTFKFKEVSMCCNDLTYTMLTYPNVIKHLKSEYGLIPGKDYQAFANVTFCSKCNLPTKTVQKIS